MKKLILFLLLLLPIPALAQVSTTTPNLGLTKPCVAGDPGCAPQGDPNWGPKINGNFDILDARVPKPTPARVTVSTKPSSPVLNEIVVVTDGLAATDCNVAGGTNNVTCQWTGTAWVPVGGGTGGGGGSASFGSITSGSNTTATMVVGSGASLAASGTGSITATAVPLTGVTGQASLVKNNQSNAFSAGDQNLSNAASFTFPTAAGAAPTGNGRCAYDSTTNRLKCGFNGATVTLAIVTESQPLSTLLTAFANLSSVPPAVGQIPYFQNATNIALAQAVLCTDTGGQHTNVTSLNPLTFSCGTSGGGSVSGGVAGTLPKYATATSLTTSIFSEALGVGKINGGLEVGDVTTNYWNPDPSLVTGAKSWTIQNISGIPLVATTEGGAITDTNIAVFKTTAGITRIVNGGAAGTGTWTDSSASIGTNKRLNAEDTGNVFTSVSVMQLDFAACPDGSTAGLQWDADATGLAQPAASCNDTGIFQKPTADFSGTATNAVERTFRLPTGWTGNIDWKMRYVTTAAGPTGNTRWEISTLCVAVGESWNGTGIFNTAQGVTDAVSSQNVVNEWIQNGLTTTGCAAGEDMTIRVARIGGDALDTNNDLAKGLYGLVTLRWVQQAQ